MSQKPNLFQAEHGSVVDASMSSQIIQKFVAEYGDNMDIFAEDVKYTIPFTSRREIIGRLRGLVSETRIVTPTLNIDYLFMTGVFNTRPVLLLVQTSDVPGRRYREYADEDNNHNDVIHLSINIWADPSDAVELKNRVDAQFSSAKLSQIRWWYTSEGRQSNHDIYLPKPETKLHPEFYPDLGDPYKFMDEYLASSASVLLMAGPPGTGKTTLLRHMISERSLLAHVIYDETLMERDSIFQNFLFDKDSDLMVIEDADTILTAREDDGNKIMARFLSVSDGLIKLPNKKLIFTTNISDFGRVDAALLRPGRCFGTVHTRPLNLPEAQAAARVAELPIPTEKGEYTLAELFNQGFRPKSRRLGFVG